MTILPPLEAGASSLLQVEDIRSEAGEDLVIHHGQTWVQDILGNIQEETEPSRRSILTSLCFVVTEYSGQAG